MHVLSSALVILFTLIWYRYRCVALFASGTVMYADLVLAPWVQALRDSGTITAEQKPLYVWDNFSAHHVDAVNVAFERAGV